MDKLDKKILSLLAQNARMSVKEIAEQVSLTSPAVSSRIHRLEKEGVIGGYTVLLKNPDSQQTVNALISVSVSPAGREEFLTAMFPDYKKFPYRVKFKNEDVFRLNANQRAKLQYNVLAHRSGLVPVALQDREDLERLCE